LDRQRQIEVNIRKTFINTIGVDSAKFGNEAHFTSFAVIIAARNGTEGSNFHIWNTVIVTIKMSGNSLASIIASDIMPMLKPSDCFIFCHVIAFIFTSIKAHVVFPTLATHYPTKDIRWKRRSSAYIFQVVVSLSIHSCPVIVITYTHTDRSRLFLLIIMYSLRALLLAWQITLFNLIWWEEYEEYDSLS
jgi:hypothetical protein